MTEERIRNEAGVTGYSRPALIPWLQCLRSTRAMHHCAKPHCVYLAPTASLHAPFTPVAFMISFMHKHTGTCSSTHSLTKLVMQAHLLIRLLRF